MNYRDCPVTDQDYLATGLTKEGVERARAIEPQVREILAHLAETCPGVNPNDLVSFLQKGVSAVGLSKEIYVRWNRQSKMPPRSAKTQT